MPTTISNLREWKKRRQVKGSGPRNRTTNRAWLLGGGNLSTRHAREYLRRLNAIAAKGR
ncbi:MAG: hypothetical protein HS116_18415 [Planctomycetes bacterium]|nr:hypothetical protein [Planctomycetota bacterium]